MRLLLITTTPHHTTNDYMLLSNRLTSAYLCRYSRYIHSYEKCHPLLVRTQPRHLIQFACRYNRCTQCHYPVSLIYCMYSCTSWVIGYEPVLVVDGSQQARIVGASL